RAGDGGQRRRLATSHLEAGARAGRAGPEDEVGGLAHAGKDALLPGRVHIRELEDERRAPALLAQEPGVLRTDMVVLVPRMVAEARPVVAHHVAVGCDLLLLEAPADELARILTQPHGARVAATIGMGEEREPAHLPQQLLWPGGRGSGDTCHGAQPR